ncbi:hypothetical protein J3R82DRAFT_2170 [Butyriboletus roseoflavus]|nr:hypothetical protein J3R82DRAFT_2170 [Butyriboletus roseoflavus]
MAMKNCMLIWMGSLGLLIVSSGLKSIARNMNMLSAYLKVNVTLPLTCSPRHGIIFSLKILRPSPTSSSLLAD